MDVRTKSLILAAAVVLSVAAGFRLMAGSDGPPFEPEEALELFEIAEGFDIELFAAEPLLSDPVAMEIDEQGRVFVVEDHGYPEARGPAGAIRLLRDTNGDGRPDSSIVFADSLRMPRGAAAWKGGLIVTDAPDILYLKDTDGDGKADVRQVLLTGFATSNPQLGINNPIFGLDNWFYIAHLHSGSDAMLPDGTPVPVAGTNFRMKLDPLRVEPLSGRSQFGHTFDAWGRHLLTINNNHIYQEVIAARYLERNPDLLLSSVHESLSDHGEASDVFPITDDPDYELFTDVGIITSACGLTSYLGGAFGAPYEGATFVAEPVHNIVHTDRLEEAGVTYRARRTLEHREFLASSDRWFRPVNFYVGPDGALYVLDYYREIVEQPKFLSEEKLRDGSLYDGDDRGRIYRIVPEGGLSSEWLDKLRLGEKSGVELAGLLGRENIWWRRTAQRLIAEQAPVEVVPELVRFAEEVDRPESRIHALHALNELRALQPGHIERALADESPAIREHGIVLAEENPSRFADALRSMVDDPAPRVQFQLLLTLGELSGAAAERARRTILQQNLDDHWMQIAALSARELDAEAEIAVASVWLGDGPSDGARQYLRRLGRLLAERESAEDLVTQIASDAPHLWHGPVLQGVAEGVGSGGIDPEAAARLYLTSTSPDLRHAAALLLHSSGLPSSDMRDAVLDTASSVLYDDDARLDARTDAVRLLAASERDDEIRTLLEPSLPPALQTEAVRAIAASGRGADFLLKRWPRMTPLVRDEAATALSRDSTGVGLLLDEVERGHINPGSIPWGVRKQIMLNADPDVRARARDLLPDARAADQEVLETYRASIEQTGDAAEGAAVFERACAMCHEMRGEIGLPFGPDLATIKSRRPESILVDILEPNREIVSGFEQWIVRLVDGSMLTGVISEETPTAITIALPGGAEQTIRRGDVASMETTGVSAMPEGLEAQISIREMADLLAYLSQ